MLIIKTLHILDFGFQKNDVPSHKHH
ncbi:MAG: hypothetical protein RIS64_4131, partial [Bacteroidota bacterium]